MFPPRLPVLLLSLCLCQPFCFAQQKQPTTPASKPKSDKKKSKKKPAKKAQEPAGWRWAMGRRPSLRHGGDFRMDFRVKMQADFRSVTGDSEVDLGWFDLRRRRVGVEGNLLRDFEYELEVEVAVERNAVRDAFVNYRRFRSLEIQAGKFKMPFGRDQVTRPMALDFICRSRLGTQLAPARDVGIMLHGRVLRRAVRYQAGWFRHDGENAFNRHDKPTGEGTWAFRARIEPERLLPLPKIARDLEAGLAFTTGDVKEGRNSLRGRTVFGESFFPRADVNGRRSRLGGELNWSPGPVSVQAEYARVSEQRRGQGIRLEDLPDVIARGWYVSGTWVVTGEKKAGGVEPRRPLLREGGFGAVELAFRQEALRFASRTNQGWPSSSPRASNLVSSSDRVQTFGVNWYLNRYVKVQGNFIRERVEALDRYPLSLVETYWSRVIRLQFVL